MEIDNTFKDQTKLFKIEVHFFDQDQGNFHISVTLFKYQAYFSDKNSNFLRPWCSFDLGEAFLIDITLKTGTCSFRSLTLFEGCGCVWGFLDHDPTFPFSGAHFNLTLQRLRFLSSSLAKKHPIIKKHLKPSFRSPLPLK